METKLNEQIDKNIGLNKRLAESSAQDVLTQVSSGLAETQKEKLASLAESVEFESEEEYREKLETLKESYFSRTAPAAKTQSTQTLSEGVDSTDASTSSTMETYLRSLGAFKQN
jgi:F0F1-type ATP synthase epsilon subunit